MSEPTVSALSSARTDGGPRRDKEFDQITGRAEAAVGAVRLGAAGAALPRSSVAHPGSPPAPPAGRRTARPAAETTGLDGALRHAWRPIGPRNIAGRIRGLACADPGTALVWYAASAGGGVWKTTNGGLRWDPLWHEQASLAVGAVAVAPSAPERVYAATGEAVGSGPVGVRGHGVYVSRDAGATWSTPGTGTPPGPRPAHRLGFEALAVHPTAPDHCWAAGQDGLFRTLDGGQSWDHLAAGTVFTDVVFAGDRLFAVPAESAAGAPGLLRLDAPGGAAADVAAALASPDSRSVVAAALPAHVSWPGAGRVAVAPSDPDIAYVRFTNEDGDHLGLYRTTNARAARGRDVTWTRLRGHPDWLEERQGDYNLCLAVDPDDAARVATGMVYLHVSTNATADPADVRWRRVMAWELNDEGLRAHHADQHALVIAGSPRALWVADDGGIARSADWATGRDVRRGSRFRPDPVRPLPPGAVHWDERDGGISGGQFYDLAQSPLVPPVLAGGLQDNGTQLRAGGLTWRQVFGADGAFAAFDPDDPFRLLISYYGGLVALQFPALLDRLYADGAHEVGAPVARFLDEHTPDPVFPPFVPETTRHPTQTGRLLHARRWRVYRTRPGRGERLSPEPLGRSFELVVRADPAAPAAPLDFVVADTPAAVGLGLVPGARHRPGREPFLVMSRLPGPYRLAEGDVLRVTLNGTVVEVRFRAADGVDPGRVAVRDVVRLLTAAFPTQQLEVRPLLWDTPSAVQLTTRATGAAATLTLGGTALDPLPDGLSRLGLNRGTYRGDDGRPVSLLLGFAGKTDEQRRTNRDLATPASATLTVAVNGGPPRTVTVAAPAFPDPTHVTAGELAAALRAALAADPDPSRRVDVTPVAALVVLDLVAADGRRVVLTGTAADRLGAPPPGAPAVRLGVATRSGWNLRQHARNWASVDLRPTGAQPLELVVSDGTASTGPLRVTAADVGDLASVTVEELHRLLRRHLTAHPAVQVRLELAWRAMPGHATALAFGPDGRGEAWAGSQDAGVFVTRDDGQTWDDVADPAWALDARPVTALVVHPRNPGTVYVGLGGEAHAASDRGFLFRSRTGGRAWTLVGHRVVAGRAEGVAVDGRPLAVNALDLDPADPGVVLAATDAGVFRSPDGGDTWQPLGEGLPNVPVVDLVTEPTTRTVRAAAWTRGVFERRLDSGPPADARLLVRATELDDGTRPARLGPALGAPAPGPLPLSSPDVVVVRRRPAGVPDVDLDGVTFDLDLPRDDVVAGERAEVVVQVTNLGALPVPAASPAPADELARVVVLWAPADAGPPPLPGDLARRIAAGPLTGPVGAWTVAGDGRVPRAIRPGDPGLRSFAVDWPALDGVGRLGLLVLVTAPADPLTVLAPTVAELVAVERRAAYAEVPVLRPEEDRRLLLVATDDRDLVVEQPTAAPGVTGVADRLGFAAADLGSPGRRRLAAVAAGPTYDLAVPGPALVVRSAAPRQADLVLFPEEADDPTSVTAGVAALTVATLAAAEGLPLLAETVPIGVALRCSGGARVRVTGGPAAARLGWAPAPPEAATRLSALRLQGFDLAGAPALSLQVRAGTATFPVAVALDPEHFADPAAADPAVVADLVQRALDAARLDGLVECFAVGGLVLRGRGDATVTASGPGVAALGLTPGPEGVLHSAQLFSDLSAAPDLHVEVTPRVVVRFDGDPADIADLATASPADVRRAITSACELAAVPVRAEAPVPALRVAASPGDTGRRRVVIGGPHLAELVASPAPVVPPEDAFRVPEVLGVDTLRAGAGNHLYLRVVNGGTAAADATRLRLFALGDVEPVAATEVAAATVAVPPGSGLVQEFSWDPGGSARTQILLAVADTDADGRRVDPPTGGFATASAAAAFVAARPGAVLRSFTVVTP